MTRISIKPSRWVGYTRNRGRSRFRLAKLLDPRALCLIAGLVFSSFVAHYQQNVMGALEGHGTHDLPMGMMGSEGLLRGVEGGRPIRRVAQDRLPLPQTVVANPSGHIKSYAQKREALYNQDWNEELQTHPELGYAPQRIPGYLYNSPRTLYGFVMRDLMTRICFRGSPQSILVVSKDAPRVIELLEQQKSSGSQKSEEDLRRQINFTVGGSTLVHAHKQGQTYYGLYDGLEKAKAAPAVDGWFKGLGNDPPQRQPSPFVLMMVDSFRSDDIVRNKAQVFLKEANPKYIVVSFGSDPNFRPYGIAAIQTLLERHYKVQLLSISHATADPYRHQGEIYRPNADINFESLREFEMEIMMRARNKDQPVRGYVFATKGLDRAIPLASDYIEDVSINDVVYKKCHKTLAEIKWDAHKQSQVHVTCNNSRVEMPQLKTTDFKVARLDDVIWHAGSTVAESEAVCTRISACKLPPGTKIKDKNHEFFPEKVSAAKVACTTRILPKQTTSPKIPNGEAQEKPNLLVLMVDPISRTRFERSLPKTNYLLQKLKFASFSQYTTADPTLYAGSPLVPILKDPIATSRQWLWDKLRNEEGYVTFKARNNCVGGSHEDSTTVDHGSDIMRMFCFQFLRPTNCIGGKPAAEHLLDHASNFMSTYSKRGKPWAAVLQFVDSHEDSQTLEGTLDDLLSKFIYSLYSDGKEKDSNGLGGVWSNTVVVLASNEGLPHGSYFQSPKGRQERNQPLLKLKLPPGLTSRAQREALAGNSKLFVSPFDVFATLRNMLLPKSSHVSKLGLSLVKPLPQERMSCATTYGIPKEVCEEASLGEVMVPQPPSALSFYADIPLQNKFALNVETEPTNLPSPTKELFSPGQECVCSTSHRKWYNCSKHPWSTSSGHSKNEHALLESFSLVDCGGLNKAYKIQRASGEFRTRKSNTKKPMFECNNSSWCSADFSKFSVFGGPNSIPNFVGYMGGCVTTTGPEHCTNRTIHTTDDGGQRTVCIDPNHYCFGLELIKRHRNTNLWCRPIEDLDGETEEDPNLSSGPKSKSRWMFDIAKSSGYVTMFAEEFCYERSPYVAQDNLFPLDADILPSTFFCRVAERQIERKGGKVHGPLWRYEGASDPNVVDVDGPNSIPRANVSLNHIETFFDAYPDVPKLVYLNAMAAHIYSRYPTQALAAEAYDKTLAFFLENILKRIENTVVVVRSDHGHQGPPNNVDYGSQIEAFRPWTEILVPKTLPGISLKKLFYNQQRLVTAADLYKTITTLITNQNIQQLMPVPSSWTIDFLNEEIPVNRTCKEARVSDDYCIFESQRTMSAPNLGTCLLAEKDQDFLCPSLSTDFNRHRAAKVDAIFNAERIEKTSCSSENVTVAPSLQRMWNVIDQQTSKYLNAKLSGGIFLYPRQIALLTSILSLLADAMQQNENRPLTVCETGFGAGHSAAMWLEASKNVQLHLFDKFDRPYQLPILNWLKEQYPDQNITHYPGNSCKTVPKVLIPVTRREPDATNDVRCDILHGSSLCRTDNIDLVERSPCGALLTTTAMKSLSDNVVYFGPNGQWTDLKERGCIRDIACYEEEGRKLDQSYVFQHSGANIRHSFCIAITTGKCQKFRRQVGLQEEACERGLANFTNRHLYLSELCRAHQVFVQAQSFSPILM